MRYILLIVLLILSPYSFAFATGVDQVTNPTVVDTVSSPASVDGVAMAATCDIEQTEDFSVCTDWTAVSGAVDCTGSVAVLDENAAGLGDLWIYNTANTSIKQWVKVELDDIDGNGDDYIGVVLRSTDTSATGRSYIVAYREQTPEVQVWEMNNGVYTGNFTDTWSQGFTNGDYMGIAIEGTGSGTIIYGWLNPSGSPDCPQNWGAADKTWTEDPTNAADTGLYTGLQGYDDDEVTPSAADNWSTGDWGF
jgi:hypothetical protein